LRKELGDFREAAFAVQAFNGVAQTCLERGGRARAERAGVEEGEDETLAGDAKAARCAVETE
jgi:hypothetical protein